MEQSEKHQDSKCSIKGTVNSFCSCIFAFYYNDLSALLISSIMTGVIIQRLWHGFSAVGVGYGTPVISR